MTDEQWTEQDQADADIRHALSAAQAAHQPDLEQLVTPDDPDWNAFQSDDPAYFLRAAGHVIRKYVGWHIFPNQKQTLKKIRCGTRGIIILPARHITQVDSIFIAHSEDRPPHFLDPHEYVWHENGVIERKGWSYYNGWQYAGYFYGNDPYYMPAWDTGFADCTFWSGYETLPDDVKTIAFELAEQAMTVRTGNIKLLESPGGYRAQTSQNFGLALNPEQMNRLANYRVGMVA